MRKFKIFFFMMLTATAGVQAQESPLRIHATFNRVEEKLNMYPVPFDAEDEMLTAVKDETFLSMEYKQKAEDGSLMTFYICKSLKKGEFLSEVKGNLVLKSNAELDQGITIEITEGLTSSGKKINGKDITSRGVLEQDLYKFITK